jgi:hypothetical protein
MVAKKFAVLKKERDQQHELARTGLGQPQGHLLSPLIDIALQIKLLNADTLISGTQSGIRHKTRVKPMEWYVTRGLTAFEESSRRTTRQLGLLLTPIGRAIVPEELHVGLDVSLSPNDRNTTDASLFG